MLVERCKLVAHTVPTDVSGYALVVDKGGVKISPTPPNGTYPEAMAKRLEKSPDAMIALPRGGLASAYLPDDTQRTFYRISMAELADAVSQPGALVVDQTGLAGSYDFYLSREEPVPGAPIAGGDRLKLNRWDQLGLKLKSVKVTAPIVVIDHIERPTPN